VQLYNVNRKEFHLFLKLLYSGQVEVVGDGTYSRLVDLLDRYSVEYKGRKLRSNEAHRVLRAAGIGKSEKSVFVVQLPEIGLDFVPFKKNTMPYYPDVVLRVGGESLRSSRGNYNGFDQKELSADRTYLEQLRKATGSRTVPAHPLARKSGWTFYTGHKAIICARCKYFNAASLQEACTIHFEEKMDKEVFRIFLNYVYNGIGLHSPLQLQSLVLTACARIAAKRSKRQPQFTYNADSYTETTSTSTKPNPDPSTDMLLTLLTLSGKYGLDDLKIQSEYLLFERLDYNILPKVFQSACSSGANQLKQVCLPPTPFCLSSPSALLTLVRCA
jgi:hypothetical protein